jgi:YesN/AraC family two-component response regulator
MADANRISMLKKELQRLGIDCAEVESGEVTLNDHMSGDDLKHLRKKLSKAGFELVDDRRSVLVEKVKQIIIRTVRGDDEHPKKKISQYISDKLNLDYTYVANLFTESTGTSIEQFYIHQKIQRVKELLLVDSINLSEISYLLNYSSVGYLSRQFKKVTGTTPRHYKKSHKHKAARMKLCEKCHNFV